MISINQEKSNTMTNENTSFDHVEQAFSIRQDHKEIAIEIYKASVKKIIHKDYHPKHNCAHTDLSAIFGVKWMTKDKKLGSFLFSPEVIAEANTAFNYANLKHYGKNKFIILANELLQEDERVSNSRLKEIGKQLEYILTATTVEVIYNE